MHAMQAAQGIVTAAMDGLRYTVAYSPHTQCTITSFAIISLIKVNHFPFFSFLLLLFAPCLYADFFHSFFIESFEDGPFDA